MTTRRSFLTTAAAAAAALGSPPLQAQQADVAERVKQLKPAQHPVIVTRETGDIPSFGGR